MIQTIHSLGIDKFPREDRLALVQAIWDSIAAEAEVPLLSETQCRELERRAAEDDAKPDDVIPWEHVKAQVLSRLKP